MIRAYLSTKWIQRLSRILISLTFWLAKASYFNWQSSNPSNPNRNLHFKCKTLPLGKKFKSNKGHLLWENVYWYYYFEVRWRINKRNISYRKSWPHYQKWKKSQGHKKVLEVLAQHRFILHNFVKSISRKKYLGTFGTRSIHKQR